MKRLFTYIIILCLWAINATAQEEPTDTVQERAEIQWDRLGMHTATFVGAGTIMLVTLEALPENATAWNRADRKATPMFKRYAKNFTHTPVFDRDNPVFNYILHPYAGAVYYNAARGSGCNQWQSFLYCFFVSNVLWEYGIECFNEIPSIQDMIITPCIGSAVGEGFHQAKKLIVKRNYNVLGSKFVGHTLCFLMDPFNEVGNLFLKKKDTVTSTYLYDGKNMGISLSYRF